MQLSLVLALVASLRLAASAPIASTEGKPAPLVIRHWLTASGVAAREEGIYTYYATFSAAKEKEKREEGIYTYYATPTAAKEKERREEGIYTYYATPDAAKEKQKREEGIYTYYAPPAAAKGKQKREEGIYTYSADPKGKEKAKREEGIYTYYADATVKERSAQDFADDVVKREWARTMVAAVSLLAIWTIRRGYVQNSRSLAAPEDFADCLPHVVYR
jgi:hypothetical protein